jgi:hypothetical protein
LLERLRLAERNDESDPDHEDDYSDGGDEESPGSPTDKEKRGKNKNKKTKDDNEDDDEGNPAPDEAPKPDVPDKRPAPPKDALSYPERVKASVAAILDADARRRGVAPCVPAASAGDDLYWRRVNATVDAIVARCPN